MPTDVTQSDKSVLITIDKLVHGGKGLAHDGAMAVFVEGVLPGESVRIQLERVKKGYAKGRLLEVMTPSPDRTTAPCPVYGQCGGGQLQHASAAAQLQVKPALLTGTLVRLGGLTDVDVPPFVASPEVYGYRNRARLAVVTPKGKTASLAYHEEGSHRLVPIAACPLLAPRLNEAVAHLNRVLAGSGTMAAVLQEGRLGLSGTTRDLMIQCEAERCTRRPAAGWFERGWDGLGLVTLVEANPAALADARYNARVNHVGRCRFRHGPAEAILDASTPDEYDLVFMDPPRTGLSKEALAGLLRLRPYRLVYLSCDPPTLARDLRAMREAGYRVTRLQGFDMFPQTMHIETLAELTQAG